jgi:hypothetical protein
MNCEYLCGSMPLAEKVLIARAIIADAIYCRWETRERRERDGGDERWETRESLGLLFLGLIRSWDSREMRGRDKELCVERFGLVFFFFFFLHECPGQLAYTTTNFTIHWTFYKSSEHVRYHESDRRAQEGSNPGTEKGNKSFPSLD